MTLLLDIHAFRHVATSISYFWAFLLLCMTSRYMEYTLSLAPPNLVLPPWICFYPKNCYISVTYLFIWNEQCTVEFQFLIFGSSVTVNFLEFPHFLQDKNVCHLLNGNDDVILALRTLLPLHNIAVHTLLYIFIFVHFHH